MKTTKRGPLLVALGFLPWITWGVLSSRGALAFAAAFAIAATLLALQARKGRVKAMEIASTAFFGAQWVLNGWVDWHGLESYNLVLLYGALGAMAWTTLIIGSPFTLQYAREDWPPALWNQPLFRETNFILTLAWSLIFTGAAVSAAWPVLDPARSMWLYGVLIPHAGTGLGVVLSMLLPRFYPRMRLRNRLADDGGAPWALPAFGARRPSQATEHDVAVVGAGIGGLAAAAVLAERGLKVLVLDHHYLPGGFCTSWPRYVGRGRDRKTYVFDGGVHDVSGLGPNGPIRWLLKRLHLEQRLDWRRMSHEYVLPDLRLKVPHSADGFRDALAGLFPAQREALAAFFTEMEAMYREKNLEVPRSQGVPFRPGTLAEMLAYPIAHPHFTRWMNVPYQDMLHQFFTDAALKRALSILSGYLTDTPGALTAGAMSSIFGYHFDGGYYPAGGSQALSDALVEAIETRGGAVRLRCPVRRIVIEAGRVAGVELAHGARERAPVVISNADVGRTFLELVGPEHLPAAFKRQVQELRPSTSATVVYLGVDFIPDLEPLTMLRTGSGDCGIAIPSKVDPSLAPDGQSALTITALTPPHLSGEWDRHAPGYRERKRKAGDALIALAEQVMPGLREHIVYRQEATPATVERYAWTRGGSIYGPALGWKPHAKTPVPGLVLAGSGVFPGAGVEAVAISGMIAADLICPSAARAALRTSAAPRVLERENEEDAPAAISQAG